MLSWWVLAALGVGVAVGSLGALAWFRRALREMPRYVTIPPGAEPIDPLARSQLQVSLGEAPRGKGDLLENLRGWATGTSDLMLEIEDMGRQLRTLHTYVLELDRRYMRREDAAWQSLQVTALVLGIATGASTAIWAIIELTSQR
jgi:hypothetical protein